MTHLGCSCFNLFACEDSFVFRRNVRHRPAVAVALLCCYVVVVCVVVVVIGSN